ncbi:MAG: four helix bundle protein [Terriglobales bacterium]
MPVASCQLPELGESMGRSYKDLIAWQKSMDLVTAIYRDTANFPREEQFGLTSQLRRAAVSIPSNIAEGQGRLSEKEFRYFLGQSRGSLMEVETHLQIGQNLGYLDSEKTSALLKACAEIGRILNGLLTSICRPPDEAE